MSVKVEPKKIVLFSKSDFLILLHAPMLKTLFFSTAKLFFSATFIYSVVSCITVGKNYSENSLTFSVFFFKVFKKRNQEQNGGMEWKIKKRTFLVILAHCDFMFDMRTRGETGLKNHRISAPLIFKGFSPV